MQSVRPNFSSFCKQLHPPNAIVGKNQIASLSPPLPCLWCIFLPWCHWCLPHFVAFSRASSSSTLSSCTCAPALHWQSQFKHLISIQNSPTFSYSLILKCIRQIVGTLWKRESELQQFYSTHLQSSPIFFYLDTNLTRFQPNAIVIVVIIRL